MEDTNEILRLVSKYDWWVCGLRVFILLEFFSVVVFVVLETTSDLSVGCGLFCFVGAFYWWVFVLAFEFLLWSWR